MTQPILDRLTLSPDLFRLLLLHALGKMGDHAAFRFTAEELAAFEHSGDTHDITITAVPTADGAVVVNLHRSARIPRGLEREFDGDVLTPDIVARMARELHRTYEPGGPYDPHHEPERRPPTVRRPRR